MNTILKNSFESIENDKLHQKVIYKYHQIDQNLYDLIINNELYFNAPFAYDLKLNLPDTNLPEQLKRYYEYAFPNKSWENNSDIKKIISSNFANKFDFKRKMDVISKQLLSNIGMCCFSLIKNSRQMWSHYSYGNTGVCLEFDCAKDPDFFQPIEEIMYVEQIPIYDATIPENNPLKLLLYNKMKNWSYEKEVRIVKRKLGSLPFNPLSFRAIYFGLKMSSKEQLTLTNLIKENKKYRHVKFYKAIWNEIHFEIQFVAIE